MKLSILYLGLGVYFSLSVAAGARSSASEPDVIYESIRDCDVFKAVEMKALLRINQRQRIWQEAQNQEAKEKSKWEKCTQVYGGLEAPACRDFLERWKYFSVRSRNLSEEIQTDQAGLSLLSSENRKRCTLRTARNQP